MGALAAFGFVISDDVIYGTVFPIIMLVSILFVLGDALRPGRVDAFCKQTSHPELTSVRLEQTWQHGERTRTSRMDDEYIIKAWRGRTQIIALKDVVWAECRREGMGRHREWFIITYDNKGKRQSVTVNPNCLLVLSTHKVKNHILIFPEREEGLRRIWKNPDEFQSYIRRSRGRGGQNTFRRSEDISPDPNRTYTMRTSKSMSENDPVEVNSTEEVRAEIQRLHAEAHPSLMMMASVPVQGVHSLWVTRVVRGGSAHGSIEFFIMEAQVDAQRPEMGTELYQTSIATREEVQELMVDFVEGRRAPDLAEWVFVL